MNLHNTNLPLSPGITEDGWRALSRPRNITLVGASGKVGPLNFTSGLIEANKALGYQGEIYLINPRHDQIFGRKAWSNLADLPEPPDAVIISLPDEKVVTAAHEAIAAGARALVIHSGGFGERGAAGAERERELKRACQQAGVAAIGPNCIGLLNRTNGVALARTRYGVPHQGPVAIISQSGSVALLLMHAARRTGVSFIASTGNEAVVTMEDLIGCAIDDPATSIIVAFVEALRRPHLLFDLARRAREANKPIIVLKAGLTEKGGTVSRGHTGALAGSGEAYRAAFAQAGIVLVEDFDELAQTLELFSRLPGTRSRMRLGVLGISGGELGHLADLSVEHGVDMPALSAETTGQLQRDLALPADVIPQNPVDVGTGFAFRGTYEERMRGAIRTVASDPSIDAVMLMQGTFRDAETADLSLNRQMLNAAAREASRISKPLLVMSCQSGRFDEEVGAEAEAAALPLLEGTRESLRAIAHLVRYRNFDGRLPADEPENSDKPWPAVWSNGTVSQEALFDQLADAGLAVTAHSRATDATGAAQAAADLGGKVVMKIDTARVVHKSDIGGVALDVTPDQAAETFERLAHALTPPVGSEPNEGVFIAEQLSSGIEFYIGAKWDATFGTVVVVGLGGRLLEYFKRTALLVTPFTRDDALEAIDRCGATGLLSGFRGGPAADLDKLADMICAVARYAGRFGSSLETLDLNPVIINAEYPGGCIADARLILGTEG